MTESYYLDVWVEALKQRAREQAERDSEIMRRLPFTKPKRRSMSLIDYAKRMDALGEDI